MKYIKQKGFTLIELLVVLSIISLLSSVVLVSLNSARKKAQISAFAQGVYQMQKALELYKSNNNGLYPSENIEAFFDYDIHSFNELGLVPNYISKIPTKIQDYAFYYSSALSIDPNYACGSKKVSGYFMDIYPPQSTILNLPQIYYAGELLCNPFDCYCLTGI